ncbi:MAG: hypothetical protein JO307_15470 [Bryobacterales bacterium]|nr:hypothetical protein [Bryobacterales bacterium]
MSVTPGASGIGNGTVTIQASANSGGPLSGTLAIAGQTFNVRQSGDACGATEVSSQLAVTTHALISLNAPYFSQQFQVVNQGGSVPGPVYLVLDGFAGSCGPTGLYSCPLTGTFAGTTCQTPLGDNSPMVLVSNGLAPGQTIFPTIRLYRPASAGTAIRVFSGSPSQ